MTGSEVPWIVLDSTVLNSADWFLEQIPARLVRRECREGHLRLALPEVVIAECTAAHEREAQDAYRKMVEHREWLWAHRTHLHFHDFEPIDEPPTLTAYRPELEAILKEAGAAILPLPDVSHAELVERAVSRRQPFAANDGGGYRDTLIWHSVLELVKRDNGSVILISKDRPAFSQKRISDKVQKTTSYEPELDRGLAAELESAGRGGAVRLFFTLREYVNTLTLPADSAIVAHWEHRLSDYDFRDSLLKAIDKASVIESFWLAAIGATDGANQPQGYLYNIRDPRVKTALVEDGNSSAEISVIADYALAGIYMSDPGSLSRRPIQETGEVEVTIEVREDPNAKSGFQITPLQVPRVERKHITDLSRFL